MRKIMTAVVAALGAVGAVMLWANAADAHRVQHWHRHWHHGRAWGPGIGLTGGRTINDPIRAPYYFSRYSFYGWGPYPCRWHEWYGRWERDCL